MKKEELIEDIKKLIATNQNDKIDINPIFLEYFQEYELEAIKNDLIFKKSQIRETTFDYLDEIYEKTKEN